MNNKTLFSVMIALLAALIIPFSVSFAKASSSKTSKAKASSKDMTLDGIIKEISAQQNIPHAQVKAALEHFFQDVTSHLKNGKKVKIFGFGTFYASKYEPKTWTNPRTKKVVNVPSRFTVKFRPSVKLKEKMNKKEDGKKAEEVKTPMPGKAENSGKTAEKADSGKKS